MSKTLSTQLSWEMTTCQRRPQYVSIYNNLFSQCKHSWLVGKAKSFQAGATVNDPLATVCRLAGELVDG